MQYQIFLFLAFLLAVLELLSIFYLVLHFDNKRIRWFLSILVLNLGWLVFNVFELLAVSEVWTVIFMKVSFVFLILLPPTLFNFSNIYLGYELRSWMKWIYLVSGLIILVMLFNNTFQVFWTESEFIPVGPYLTVNNTYGPFFIFNVLVSYVFLFASLILIIAHFNTIASLHRKSALIIILAMSFCLLFNFSYVMGFLPFEKDFSPIAFGVSILTIIYFIIAQGMFEITIVPRKKLFDYIESGMVIFNETGIVLDTNPSALSLLKKPVEISEVLGKKAEDVFPFWNELRFFQKGEGPENQSLNKSQMIVITVDDELKYFDVVINSLKSASVLILHDVSEIQRLLIRIEELANFDVLTKLRNRRSFFNTANILVKYSKRNRQAISIILIDIDNFKIINDRLGHMVGDVVLKNVAEILERTLRAVDLKARYGGDEFIILLPQTELKDAKVVAQKLIDQVKNHDFAKADQAVNVTLSLGISGRNIVNQKFKLMEVIEEADAALYHAKKTGKDKILVHSSFEKESELETAG